MSQTHRASAGCAVSARVAFGFLADGRRLGRWSLGWFGARRVDKGLFRGRSLFDGRSLLVRPVADPSNLAVYYFAGASRKALAARLFARAEKRGARRCRVSLVAQRPAGTSLGHWRRLKACLEVEVRLIQAIVGRKRKT